jgi:hypothetical protein
MRPWLLGAVLIGSAAGCALSELFLLRTGRPPDASSAVLAGLWLAMPYLGAAGLAALFRRHTPALTALLIALLVTAPVALSLYHASATQQEIAEREAETAVLPGEDPARGPAAMRKTGADVGAALTWGFSVFLAVVVPPVQLAALLFPTLITWGATGLARRREAQREEGEPGP